MHGPITACSAPACSPLHERRTIPNQDLASRCTRSAEEPGLTVQDHRNPHGNNIAVIVIGGGIACLTLGERPLLWRGLVALAAAGIGVLLHWGARAWLGRLKP